MRSGNGVYRKFVACNGGLPGLGTTVDVHHEHFSMHVCTKNLQSIRSDARLEDLFNELAACDYDVFFLSETWKSQTEESFALMVVHPGPTMVIQKLFPIFDLGILARNSL